jgi:hypothetical protein
MRPWLQAYCALEGNFMGGALHIVLDDGNVRDKDVRWCAAQARDEGDETGALLAEALLKMSVRSRLKLGASLYSTTQRIHLQR